MGEGRMTYTLSATDEAVERTLPLKPLQCRLPLMCCCCVCVVTECKQSCRLPRAGRVFLELNVAPVACVCRKRKHESADESQTAETQE